MTLKLVQDFVKVNPKFRVRKSNGTAVSVLTNWQTHRHTGPILYPRPLTREGIIQISSVTHCHFMHWQTEGTTLIQDRAFVMVQIDTNAYNNESYETAL